MADKQRAGLYARVSTSAQAGEDKTSLAEQVSAIEAYCKAHGLTVSARYEDVGSGVDRSRSAFQRLQADARAGALDVVIAWKSDRLARSGSSMGDLLDAVEVHKVEIHTVAGVFDRRYAELLASIARMERDAILERTALGKVGAARQGKWPAGSLPYGLRRGADGRPEIVEAEADVVRRLFDLYANERLGVPAIRNDTKGQARL